MSKSRFNNLDLFGHYIRQGGARQLLAGLLFKHKLSMYDEEENDLDDVIFNAWAAYRWADAIIPIARIDINPDANGMTRGNYGSIKCPFFKFILSMQFSEAIIT